LPIEIESAAFHSDESKQRPGERNGDGEYRTFVIGNERSYTGLPFLKGSAGLEGSGVVALDDDNFLAGVADRHVRQHKDFRGTDVVPAGFVDNRESGFSANVIQVMNKMLTIFACNDVKAAACEIST
jgi:hypothetical protein